MEEEHKKAIGVLVSAKISFVLGSFSLLNPGFPKICRVFTGLGLFFFVLDILIDELRVFLHSNKKEISYRITGHIRRDVEILAYVMIFVAVFLATK